MYHTKMYPKFLLLPKCSKLKVTYPLIGNKRLQVTKIKITHKPSNHFIQFPIHFSPKQVVFSCACIKMHNNILCQFFFHYKAKLVHFLQ